jgi:hypothetical protein
MPRSTARAKTLSFGAKICAYRMQSGAYRLVRAKPECLGHLWAAIRLLSPESSDKEIQAIAERLFEPNELIGRRCGTTAFIF